MIRPLLVTPTLRISVTAAVLTSIALTAVGCRTPIGVSERGGDHVFRRVNANALTHGVASEFSSRVLARFDLSDRFESDPEGTLRQLRALAGADTDRDRVFALAELSYLTGRDYERKRHFLAAAFYAYFYLFSDRTRAAENPYDPRFRIACDLYNRSLAEFFREADGFAHFKSGTVQLPFGTMDITVSRPGFPWGEEDFGQFVPASDFVVRGLRDRHRTPGLGLPLIAIRTPPEDQSKRTEDLLPRSAKISATAFLRVAPESVSLAHGNLRASLELYAPFNRSQIAVRGRQVPLEADLTAPIAYGLNEPRIWKFEFGGFLAGDQEDINTGIFLLQPYSPGKIPVVFVHGTASSPARWAEMFNGLQGYEQLREKYQFWFFIYTTGNPIAYSAMLLRRAVKDAVESFDPEGKDPALRNMVMIGHSQGGLLTRMQVIETGDSFWRTISDEDLGQLDIPPDDKALLREALFIKPSPFVRRVVFVATPHRGSFLAGNWLGRLASKMVRLPGRILRIDTLFRSRPTVFKRLRTTPTSVENMDPENPFIQTLSSIPLSPEVKAHSIIAVKGHDVIASGNDGVVEYSSAHLDEAVSEYIVFSGHSCQAHPMTILEVRRILQEHLEAGSR